MWAHYADRFTGVCLVFDRASLITAVESELSASAEFVCNGLINYKLPTIGEFVITEEAGNPYTQERAVKYVRENPNLFYFAKHTSWEYEKEFRIVALMQSAGDTFVPIKESLVGVVFGHNSPFIESEIRAFNYKIDIFRQFVQGSTQTLDAR
jgi:hypothetical protein